MFFLGFFVLIRFNYTFEYKYYNILYQIVYAFETEI